VTTHFAATLTLLGVILGMLTTLIGVVWKSRGYIDRLNETDGRLADAITSLQKSQENQHQENQRRFERIEDRLTPVRRRR
jgi:flagellar capping protein FliD